MATYKLSDICSIKSGKRIPLGMDFTDEKTDHPYIRARDIKDGVIHSDDLIYLDDRVWQRIKKYIINSGDIAITIVGASVGDVAYADSIVDGFSLTENAVRLTDFKQYVNGKYLFYLIFQRQYKEYMQTVAGGAAQPKLGIYKIERIKVELPALEQQNRVVKYLSQYDSLIELNNKRIKLLEQMAENLYKEWFVRFRFPGHETIEFEEGIPKGWEYKKLDKVFDVRYGKDHKNVEDGRIPIFGSGGVIRYGNRALYSGESVLVPRKGTLNNIMYFNGDFWTVDTMFYTVLLIENFAKYAYYTMSKMDMESLNSGAALPSMTTEILYHLKILVPDAKTLELFDGFVGAVFDNINMYKKENDNLIKQRDLLLPRLMSGKLEV